MFANPFVYYTPDTSYSRRSRQSCASFPFEQSCLDIDQLNALRAAEIRRKQREQAELRRQYELRLAQIEEYHKQQELELRRREAYTRKVQEQRRLQAQKRAEEKQRRLQQQQAEAQRYNEFISRTINNLFGAEESNAEPEHNVFDPTPAFKAIYSIFNEFGPEQPVTEKVQSKPDDKSTEKSVTPKDESTSEKSAEPSEEKVEKESEEDSFDPTETLNTLISIVNSVFNEPETNNATSEETEKTEETEKIEKTEKTDNAEETKETEKDESESHETDDASVSESEVATKAIAEEESASVESQENLTNANENETEVVTPSTSLESSGSVPEAENTTEDDITDEEDTTEEEYVLVEEKDEPVETSPDSSKPKPTLTDTLNSISKKIDHNVAVYERVSKHSTEAYTDSESDSISSLSAASESSSSATSLILRSRIKVLQRAQLELENIYEKLDNIETPSDISDKRLKQVLTGKAVSYADKIDELRNTLVKQLEKSRAKTASDTSEETSSNTVKEQSNNKSSVRHIMVETVPDEALSE